MGSEYVEVLVKCPFFKSIKQDKIKCEGPFKNTSTLTAFREPLVLTTVIKDYCCEAYTTCPLYLAIVSKYENCGGVYGESQES